MMAPAGGGDCGVIGWVPDNVSVPDVTDALGETNCDGGGMSL